MKQASLNGNLILKPYSKIKQLTADNSIKGFAMMAEKIGIEPLELLMDTVVDIGQGQVMHIPKGSQIFFKEEVLYSQQWARKIFKSDEVGDQFVIGNLKDMVFFKMPEELTTSSEE